MARRKKELAKDVAYTCLSNMWRVEKDGEFDNLVGEEHDALSMLAYWMFDLEDKDYEAIVSLVKAEEEVNLQLQAIIDYLDRKAYFSE